jgi:hypothetical protein
MSAYLTVYIHKIGEPIKEDENSDRTNMIELFMLCTSPCRELYGTLNTTYYGDDSEKSDPIYGKYHKVLTPENLADIHNFYKEKIAQYNTWIEEDEKEISENNDLIVKASSIDVVHDLRDNNSELKDSISNFKQERDEYIYLDNEFSNAESILEQNKPYDKDNPYELVYSME